MITHAMIFAAGKGTRMMPLTADRPKPMLELAGKPLLGHAIDKVLAAGIEHIVVNTHHCAAVAHDYLRQHPAASKITISHESEILETGGGVKHALERGYLPKDQPFLAINADILWTGDQTLTRMIQAWQSLGNRADELLLLTPKQKAWGHDSTKADYNFNQPEQKLGTIKLLSSPEAHYVYAGLQIVRPQLYFAHDFGPHFSNIKIFKQVEESDRLYGLAHEGGWFHFSTPESLDRFVQEGHSA